MWPSALNSPSSCIGVSLSVAPLTRLFHGNPTASRGCRHFLNQPPPKGGERPAALAARAPYEPVPRVQRQPSVKWYDELAGGDLGLDEARIDDGDPHLADGGLDREVPSLEYRSGISVDRRDALRSQPTTPVLTPRAGVQQPGAPKILERAHGVRRPPLRAAGGDQFFGVQGLARNAAPFAAAEANGAVERLVRKIHCTR